jgi:hypothetical protein
VERILANIDAYRGNGQIGFFRHGGAPLTLAPSQHHSPVGQEHGRTIPLAEKHGLYGEHACGTVQPHPGCSQVEALVKLLPPPGQPRLIRYGAAIVLVAVFFVISLGGGVAAGPFEFVLLLLPVLLAAVLYDRGSGFVATGLGALAMASQLDWQVDPVGHFVAVAIFTMAGLFIAVFCEALRSALERGLIAQRELQLLLQEQRHRVKNDLALLSR